MLKYAWIYDAAATAVRDIKIQIEIRSALHQRAHYRNYNFSVYSQFKLIEIVKRCHVTLYIWNSCKILFDVVFCVTWQTLNIKSKETSLCSYAKMKSCTFSGKWFLFCFICKCWNIHGKRSTGKRQEKPDSVRIGFEDLKCLMLKYALNAIEYGHSINGILDLFRSKFLLSVPSETRKHGVVRYKCKFGTLTICGHLADFYLPF